MNEFETYTFETLAQRISSWDAAVVEDVYALAFLILNDADEVRRPTIRLLYNTETEWQRRRDECRDPSGPRWNHPFWLQTAHASIATAYPDCDAQNDTKGIVLREAWISQRGWWYDDQFEAEHLEQALEIGARPCREFGETCVRVAARLGDVGIMSQVFGRDLPIIFFDREAPSPQAIELTNMASPQPLISECLASIDEVERRGGA